MPELEDIDRPCKPFEFQKQIEEIMDQFDFHKVSRVMEFMEWKWSNLEPSHVPEPPELRKVARQLLKRCAEFDEDNWISTGGLHSNLSNGYLSLSFVIEDWDTCL